MTPPIPEFAPFRLETVKAHSKNSHDIFLYKRDSRNFWNILEENKNFSNIL